MSTQNKYIGIDKKEKYDTNPFWALLKDEEGISARKKELTRLDGRFDEEGRVVGFEEVGIGQYSYYFNDSRSFVKCFSEFKVGVLNADALKIIDIFFSRLKPKQDYVFLSALEYSEITKSGSRNGYYKGIKNLIDNDVIRGSKSANMYFINPLMIFNGDAMATMNKMYDAESEYRLINSYGKQANNLRQKDY